MALTLLNVLRTAVSLRCNVFLRVTPLFFADDTGDFIRQTGFLSVQ